MCSVFLFFVGFIRDSMREIIGCINVKLPVVGLLHVKFYILGFLIFIITGSCSLCVHLWVKYCLH
jgi:hypothetical protein